MKNLFIPFLVFTILTLSSCYKDWTCSCVLTFRSTSNPDSVFTRTREYTLTGFKAAKKKECEEMTVLYFESGFGGNNNIQEDQNCELK